MIENLYHVYYQSSDSERRDGLRYYRLQRQRLSRLASRTNSTLPQAVGVFCALSPNNDEIGNYRDALTILSSKGLDLDVKVSTYGLNKRKAMRIAIGERPLDVLRGNKVRSFYLNTIDPDDDFHVTVDGHIANVWHGHPRNLVKTAGLMNDRLYCQISDGVRIAAKELRLRPSQLQSTLWLTWKRIHRIRYTSQSVLFNIEDVVDWKRRIVPDAPDSINSSTSSTISGASSQTELVSRGPAGKPPYLPVTDPGGEAGPAGRLGVPDQKVLQF